MSTPTPETNTMAKPIMSAARINLETGERDIFNFHHNVRIDGSSTMRKEVTVHMLSSEDEVNLFACMTDSVAVARQELAAYVTWRNEGPASLVRLDMENMLLLEPQPQPQQPAGN